MAQTIYKPTAGIKPPYRLSDLPGYGYRLPGGSSVVRGISRALSRRRFSAYVKARAAGQVRLDGHKAVYVLGKAETALDLAYGLVEDVFASGASLLLLIYRILCAAFLSGARLAYNSYCGLRISISRRHISRLNYALIMGVFLAVVFSSCFYGMGFEVYLNGQSVGYIENRQAAESAINRTEDRVSEILGTPYQMVPNISYRFGIFDRRNMADLGQVEESLFNGVKGVEKLYVLTVDGEIIGASRDRLVLDGLLSSLIAKYPSASSTDKIEFLNDVSVTQKYISTEYLVNPDAMKEKLNSNVREKKTYIVKSGDTVGAIASENGMTSDDLIALNPGLSEESIKAGKEIIVKSALPFISLKQTKKLVYSEKIAYETTTVQDSSLYKGQTKVKVEGKNGEAQITANAVYINGKEQSREIINRVVVSEPVTKVTLVGTKAVPPKSPTGAFMRPFRGIVTSNYGYRGREFHTGVDFAGPYGSSIVASDGGTVVYSGWYGSYGRCIIVSHGNGLETLYGHCSKLLVTVGQKVAKGETIAKLGSSGRSTGPHVHFEVRKNGSCVNPWKYIK